MYTKQELDVVGTYEADTVRDEDLLNMAKNMYKEGLLKASVKYDPNIMEYRVTVVHTYRDEKDKKYNSSEETDTKTNSDSGSVKDMNEERSFFRRIFNS